MAGPKPTVHALAKIAKADADAKAWTAAKLERLGWAASSRTGGLLYAAGWTRGDFEARAVYGERRDGEIVFMFSWPGGSMTLIHPTVPTAIRMAKLAGYPGDMWGELDGSDGA